MARPSAIFTSGIAAALASRPARAALLLLATQGAGCDGRGVRLSRSAAPSVEVPLDGPELGAITLAAPVRNRPASDGTIIGYLHAGSRVHRSPAAVSQEACVGGWYAIHPRGFVCLAEGATLDMNHPTLETMATRPELEGDLPYAYARTLSDAQLFAVNAQSERSVLPDRPITSRSGMAVVGSWEAATAESARPTPLAMMTNGRFLEVSNLEEAKPSEFSGVELDEQTELPVAFVIGRDAQSYEFIDGAPKASAPLGYHRTLPLGSKRTKVNEQSYLQTREGNWVREEDVRVAEEPKTLPDFAKDATRWIDVGLANQVLVAFEGNRAKFATLVSTGKTKSGADRATRTGDFVVVAKHVTALNAQVRAFADRVEIHDTPWVLELSSGQLLHGSYWHDRFGNEHGLGYVQLSPKDARRIWSWANGPLPAGWHAIISEDSEDDLAALLERDKNADAEPVTRVRIHQ